MTSNTKGQLKFAWDRFNERVCSPYYCLGLILLRYFFQQLLRFLHVTEECWLLLAHWLSACLTQMWLDHITQTKWKGVKPATVICLSLSVFKKVCPRLCSLSPLSPCHFQKEGAVKRVEPNLYARSWKQHTGLTQGEMEGSAMVQSGSRVSTVHCRCANSLDWTKSPLWLSNL